MNEYLSQAFMHFALMMLMAFCFLVTDIFLLKLLNLIFFGTNIIVCTLLKLLKASKAGAPGSLFDRSHHDKYKWGSKQFKAAEKKASVAGFKRWGEILDSMIYSFGVQLNEDADSKFHTKKGYDKVGYDKLGYDKFCKKVQEGFDLFGNTYQTLWT
jgi:hypothetical protein